MIKEIDKIPSELQRICRLLQYQKNYSEYTVENYCSDIVQYLDYLTVRY